MTVRIECNGESIEISQQSFEDVMECIDSAEDHIDEFIVTDRDDHESLHYFSHVLRSNRKKGL